MLLITANCDWPDRRLCDYNFGITFHYYGKIMIKKSEGHAEELYKLCILEFLQDPAFPSLSLIHRGFKNSNRYLLLLEYVADRSNVCVGLGGSEKWDAVASGGWPWQQWTAVVMNIDCCFVVLDGLVNADELTWSFDVRDCFVRSIATRHW